MESQSELTVVKVVSGTSIASLGRLERFLEPDVIVRRVVWDNVDENLDVGLFEGRHHFVKVFEGTDPRVDISVVGHIVCREYESCIAKPGNSQPPSLRALG